MTKDAYVRDVIGQIFEKDIRFQKRICNGVAFECSTSYVINNFGGYLDLLENAELAYRCPPL